MKHFADPLTIAKLIHPLRRLDQVFAFFEFVVTDVDPQMRPGKAGRRARAPAHVAPGNEIAFVVITKDVQDDILGGVLARCRHLAHTAIRLVHTVVADAVVTDRFLQARREVVLPGLAIVDLVTIGETVTVGVDA